MAGKKDVNYMQGVTPEEFKLHYDYYIASYNLHNYLDIWGKTGKKYKQYYTKFLEAFNALNNFYI